MGNPSKRRMGMLMCAIGKFLNLTREDTDAYNPKIDEFSSNDHLTEDQQFKNFVIFMSAEPNPVGSAVKFLEGSDKYDTPRAKARNDVITSK